MLFNCVTDASRANLTLPPVTSLFLVAARPPGDESLCNAASKPKGAAEEQVPQLSSRHTPCAVRRLRHTACAYYDVGMSERTTAHHRLLHASDTFSQSSPSFSTA